MSSVAAQSRPSVLTRGPSVPGRTARGVWRRVVAQVLAHRDHTVTASDLVLAAGLARPDCLVVGRIAAAYHGAPVAAQPPVAIQVHGPGWSIPSGLVGRMVDVDEPGILRIAGIGRVAPRRWAFIDALATMPWDEARNLYAYLASFEQLQRGDIEVDGRSAHERHFVRDRRRDATLSAAGWVVVRVTWWDLTERPDALVTQIRQLLAHAR